MAVTTRSDTFLLDAYSGQGGFADGSYLIRHPRESDEKYARRQELAVYPNFVRKVVDTYLGFLWRRTPVREADDLYAAFAENADGAGHDLDHVMTAYQRLALLLGTVYVVVDRPAVDAVTRAQEPLPYLSVRLPGQLIQYQADMLGNFTLAVFQEQHPDGLRYRGFDLEGWWLGLDPDGNHVLDRGKYNLGRVPVARLHASQPLNPADVRAVSWAQDLARLNLDLYNLRSELRELLRSQTFSILALPVSDPAERERLTDMTVSTENAILYDPTGGGQPGFIAPPDGPVKLYMEQIAATIEDIYRVANLEFVGGVQQSGVALSFHFQEANAALGALSDLAERAETEIAVLVHAWMGREWDGNIAYPRDFNLNDLAQELALALDAVSLSVSPGFEVALKKRLARQILGDDVAPSEMEQILREIEAGGDPLRRRIDQAAGG